MSRTIRQRTTGESKFKALVAVPFLASVVIHLVIFLLVGTVVIFEGSIPRQLFDTFDVGAYEASESFTPPPLMEEEPLETEAPVDNPLEDATPSPDDMMQEDLSMDIITTETASSAPSFFMPSMGSMSMAPSESPALSGPSKKSQKSEVAKSLLFDTGQRKASQVNFFKIKQVASRIVIAVDVSKSMVSDARGGTEGYQALKNEVVEIINGLNEETAFNIVMFGGAVDLFQYKLTPATDSAKEDAKRFLEPYMTEQNANKGNLLRNYTPSSAELSLGPGGSTRMDLALTAGFEQGADAIFILSDGAPVVARTLEPEHEARRRKAQAALSDFLAGTITKDDAEKIIKDADYSLEPFRNRLQQEREFEGMTKEQREEAMRKKGSEGLSSYWQGNIDREQIFEHIEKIYKMLYEHQGRKQPVIHCVGYITTGHEESFMEELAEEYGGRFRRIENKLVE